VIDSLSQINSIILIYQEQRGFLLFLMRDYGQEQYRNPSVTGGKFEGWIFFSRDLWRDGLDD
jgi:hypothetical protein